MKYICSVCGYIYDEAKEGTPFADLPADWVCPLCRASKDLFHPQDVPAEKEKLTAAPVSLDEDMLKLSAGQLSCLFSNLARGCEKQYQNEAKELFSEISDYFKAITPPEENADLEHLADLVKNDLDRDYEILKAAARQEQDRGTQRICVWGEKVTRMLSSIISRCTREGTDFLQNTEIWVCTVCGFVYVGDTPPELCPVCKVPSWKFEKIERRA